MWYWNQDNFQRLAGIAAQLASAPALHTFARYRRYREQGLRQRTLAALDRFSSQEISDGLALVGLLRHMQQRTA